MCGIAGIIKKGRSAPDLKQSIRAMCSAMSHRGPDGEGFMLADSHRTQACFADLRQDFQKGSLDFIPNHHIENNSSEPFLVFGHRRLSIIDLSQTGHQPMCVNDRKLWITFNGEIYNYKELREELISLGCTFFGQSDTEVVLIAYLQWGQACVQRFNGMWAFCIYDSEKQICFASRDRFGVKPFYYVDQDVFAFASEQKALVRAQLVKPEANDQALHDYLINASLERTASNFFNGIQELFPGHNLIFSLKDNSVSIARYYQLQSSLSNESLDDESLLYKIRQALFKSVELRMRSDVEVGTCLSGGIDSSVISGIMSRFAKDPVHCFTSVFRDQPMNEEPFADLAAKFAGAKHHKIQPDLNGFLHELDTLIYSQDVPIWDTSTYAQYSVMKLASQNNIKVVLDGQGADELFAGYHHHFIARWNSLFYQGRYTDAIRDIKSARKTFDSPFVFYAKEKFKEKNNPELMAVRKIFDGEFSSSFDVRNPAIYFNSVNEQLIHDVETARLKSFLKCEDRCGMWHSVESRTPFSDDISLIELMFSFDGDRKIDHGVSKYFLRESARHVLPGEIYSRYDKRGFETPMHSWLKEIFPMMREEILDSCSSLLDKQAFEKIHPENFREMKYIFRLFVYARWKKVFRVN